jgi:hypothetical protein
MATNKHNNSSNNKNNNNNSFFNYNDGGFGDNIDTDDNNDCKVEDDNVLC